MAVHPQRIVYYQDERGRAPFVAWHSGLTDKRAYARILARILRLEAGNFGDSKPVGGGVSELRIDFSPGYRVYFARQAGSVVILLGGGDKRTQRADILAAQDRWREIQEDP